jgi:hypothetical protein
VERKKIATRGLRYFAAAAEGAALPPAAARLLADRVTKGRTGREGPHPEMNALLRPGKVVPFGDEIFYTKETCDAIAAEILAGRKRGDRFSVPEARERTGLAASMLDHGEIMVIHWSHEDHSDRHPEGPSQRGSQKGFSR